MDPPGCWPNLDLLFYQFWKEKWKIILEKFFFLFIRAVFKKNLITKCYLLKILLSWVSLLWISILNLALFSFILSSIYMCGSGSAYRIRIPIQKAPEYRSNTVWDPDPQHCSKPSIKLIKLGSVLHLNSIYTTFCLGENKM